MGKTSLVSGPSTYAWELGQAPMTDLFKYVAVLALVTLFVCSWRGKKEPRDDTLIVNRGFFWEPAIFARLRWMSHAGNIINAANETVIKAQGRPYRLYRGDIEQIVLPPSMIPELNRLSTDVLNSRESHAYSLLGHLTGMDVIRKTSFHVRALQSHVTPALPGLFALASQRMSDQMRREFPQTSAWTALRLSHAVVCCASEAIALSLFGADMTADDPELSRLTHQHTSNVFQISFAMRCVPRALQPLLVWLMPAKWRLTRGWKRLRAAVGPRILELKQLHQSAGKGDQGSAVKPDVISWMVGNGTNEMERDADVLTTLIGSLAAGSTYSITNFCCRAIVDLVAHPDVMEAVRTEMQQKHAQVHGRWDMAAIAGLEKLESAMKESSRLTPGTMLLYSRVVMKDHQLSSGIFLKRGQFVTISGAARTLDPAIFENPDEYQGLRFCSQAWIERHRARPFSSVDSDILTWGAGRWSCPGRLITDMTAKILLVKLLSEYDFAFVGNDPPARSVCHEFVFFHPDDVILARQRRNGLVISFV